MQHRLRAYWQGLGAGYNPRIVEETWEFIANSVAPSFNVGSAGILLNIDVHGDVGSAVPDVAFQETNTNSGSIYSNGSYNQTLDGPDIQDCIIFCDLVGEPLLGQSFMLGEAGGNAGTTSVSSSYYAYSP